MSIRLGALAIGLIATASTASASCGAREVLIQGLESKYSEKLAARGLQQNARGSAIVEIWASEDSGTFTVLMTNANGQSCIMASGTHWFLQDIDLAAAPQGIPG